MGDAVRSVMLASSRTTRAERTLAVQTPVQRKTDWSIRKATPEDGDGVSDFIGVHSWGGHEHARELYQWRYQNAARGKTIAMIAANDQKDIVATGMFMPWQLSLGDQTISAYQWADLFIRLEYRGQAIADRILKNGLEETRKCGSEVCFAFPTNQSVPLQKKNGGFHLGRIVRLARPLSVKYLVQRVITNDFAASALSRVVDRILMLVSRETYTRTSAIERVDKCGVEFDELWLRLRETYKDVIVTRKDKDYLNWRYLQCPDACRKMFAVRNNGRVEGFIVVESAPQIGYIIDVMATSAGVLAQLVAFSIKYFRREKKESVVFVALEENAYLRYLKSFWFFVRPEVRHLYLYLDDLAPHAASLRDPRKWFLTMGDCHVEHM